MTEEEIEVWIRSVACPEAVAAAVSEIRNAELMRDSEVYRSQIHELAQQHLGLIPAILRLIQTSTFAMSASQRAPSNRK